MAKKHYWIGVACKDQVFVGVKGGFAQLAHGKGFPLQKMDEGDWLICYSPRTSMNSLECCQSFTAIGRIANDEVYQFDSAEDFSPYRLEVDFELCEETSILPLIDRLSFIEDKKSWGYPFRLGHLEISEEDFELLAEEMGLDVNSIKH
jgi:predicted RNA-binding protein